MANLSELLKKTRVNMKKGIEKAVVDTGFGIVERQGKYSGQLRASTNMAFSSPDLSQVTVANYERNAITNTRSLARSKFKHTMQSFELGQVVFISNNKDYALNDEYEYGRLAFESGKDQFQSRLDKAFSE